MCTILTKYREMRGASTQLTLKTSFFLLAQRKDWFGTYLHGAHDFAFSALSRHIVEDVAMFFWHYPRKEGN